MIKIVTGYVPLLNHPRTAEEYGKLGDQLATVRAPIKAFYTQLKDCWMTRFLWEQSGITPAVADNPKKNTIAYHCVQHQKVEWLLTAATIDKDSTHFAWVDYGIFSVSGITATVIEDYLWRAKGEKAIAIPGCWPKGEYHDDDVPNWRFCGGLILVPRAYIRPLYDKFKDVAMKKVWKTKQVTWEVNTLANLEEKHPELPLWWYQADHNSRMFTDYKETHQ